MKNNKPVSGLQVDTNVEVHHARDGKVVNKRKFHNAAMGTILSRLAYAIASGMNGVEMNAFATIASDLAAGKDGIGAFTSSADATKNAAATMSYLLGTVTAATNNNQVIFSGHNTLTTPGTKVSAFALGYSCISAANAAGQAFSLPMFTHDLGAGGSFSYANGDTLSVTWTVSVTT